MRDKIFDNRESKLHLGLVHPEAKTMHVVSYGLAHLKNGPSKVLDGVDRVEWDNGSMANFKVLHENILGK
ncbi:hypothetical protein EPI10_005328 [Gossypium australe]|uniref:Uncharacterized protein n=1 Tax=Gossypium australe TaxID=47621 RepID=A0A5B6WQP0_9ROSI|nr:hypothetical protein EPI10_005328 [Gossypium australe]